MGDLEMYGSSVSIECSDVSVSYRAEKRKIAALASASLSVPTGSSVAIMGPSGSGKSTLLKVIAGLIFPESGTIKIGGNKLDQDSAASLRGHIGIVHQDYRLVPFLSARNNVLFAVENAPRPSPASSDDVDDLLADLGIAECADRVPGELSGGQQQRVAIARALVGTPQVLLADEPTGALDARTSAEIADVLTSAAHQHQVAVLLATHDLAVAQRMDRVLHLRDGVLSEVA